MREISCWMSTIAKLVSINMLNKIYICMHVCLNVCIKFDMHASASIDEDLYVHIQT